MQGAAGGVAAEIKDGRRDLGKGEHRPALDPALGRERLQRGGDVRGAEGARLAYPLRGLRRSPQEACCDSELNPPPQCWLQLKRVS